MSALTAKKLNLLHRLSRLLAGSDDLKQVLDAALKLLASELGLARAAITLVSPRSGQIRIEAACGLNAAQRRLGEYAPGEGITGTVIAAGQPMCVADVSREPLFLNRTQARSGCEGRLSFLCVPIILAGQAVGALAVDILNSEETALSEELKLLEIVAAMLAQTARESQERMGEAPSANKRPPGFIGSSEAMLQVYDQIAIVAPSATTVLLQGESGTGKELAAHAIHAASSRAHGPFISLNCAALPENLIESELFGHERGAFTGATQMRKGRFELASGGTLFLDEVGELSPLVQVKLLRILQERSFERLGGMHTVRADVRLITATNRNLAKMVEDGSFRRDLFYRLNVFPIYLPPLRGRSEDILPLAAHFLDKFGQANGKRNLRISLAAMQLLERYAWPGNIRELQNTMERAALLTGHGNMVLPQHLSLAPEEQSPAAPADYRSLGDELALVERERLEGALIASRGNIREAAGRLGLTQRVMGLRMKKHNLSYKKFRRAQPPDAG